MQRRDFIAGAGAAVAGLAARAAGAATEGATGQMPRRTASIPVIDFHSHAEIDGIRKMVGDTAPFDPQLTIGPERLKAMDEQGIDIAVFSINPFWYAADEATSRRAIKAQNEGLAEACSRSANRFYAVATVALQHPQLAAEQLTEAVTRLGLRGVSIGSAIGRDEISAPKFDPFWAKAEELGVPVFLHPQGVPELDARLAGNGMLGHVIASPLATTIALSRLIFEGTLDRFPGLKVCAAHGGGYLPSYVGRSDYGCGTRPHECTGRNKKLPSEYLRQMYFDAMVFTDEGLRHLVAVCGASQIVLGTDDPYPWTARPADARLPQFRPVDHVRGASWLEPAERDAILSGNAARLLGIRL